jgi:predicted ABC-type ATPase
MALTLGEARPGDLPEPASEQPEDDPRVRFREAMDEVRKLLAAANGWWESDDTDNALEATIGAVEAVVIALEALEEVR